MLQKTFMVPDHDEQRVSTLQCPACSGGVVVIEQKDSANEWHGFHWWPPPGIADLDESLLEPVASAFAEGMRALSANCPRAAVVMFRAMLAEVVSDQASEAAREAPTLYKQLEMMQHEGSLHPSLVAWASEIRSVGNVGAHPNPLEAVGPDDAEDLARLCRRLIDVVYETPARIERARARRGPQT